MPTHCLVSPQNSLLFPFQSHHQKPYNLNPKPLKPPSISRYNSLIRTHIESHQPKQALSLFRHLLSHPTLLPDNYTFPLILKVCAHLSSLELTQQIHCMILKSQSTAEHDIYIYTSLLNTYAQCGSIDDARLVFDKMRERNVVTWNCMLSGFVKCGDMGSVVKFFDEMPERNIVSWNLVLGGYVKANMSREALVLLIEMQVFGFKPDETTMVSVVSAISDMGLLDLGRRAHAYIVRSELSLNGALGVALITMYGRCGIIDTTYKVFLMIQVKNVGHLTSVISELANHGLTDASLRVFSEMLHSGIKPNHITFIGVLNACRHAGLTEEGLRYFNLMRSFDIEPRIEHYGCLVDLLGRCGLVEEAMEMACNKPMDPGFVIWGTLLAACKNNGHVEIAEIVAKKLIELKPQHGSPYLLLSNLYARKGRWEDFGRMRNMMEEKRVVKVPGLSWIEVGGRVHEFVAGDQFHVKAKDMYRMLEEIKGNLRCEGYESVADDSVGSIEEEEDLGIEYPIA